MDFTIKEGIKEGISRLSRIIPYFRKNAVPVSTNRLNGLEIVLDEDTIAALRNEIRNATEYFIHHARPTTEDVKIDLEWSDQKSFLLNLLYNDENEKIKLPFMYVCISPKKVTKIEGTRDNVPPCILQAQDILDYYYKERGFKSI